MTKWVILMLLVGMAAGVGLWMITDPNASVQAAQMWLQIRVLYAQATAGGGSSDLLAPITKAFKDFADSVGGLWSGGAVQIQVPSVELPH